MTDQMIREINAMNLEELYDLADYITCVKKKRRRAESRGETNDATRTGSARGKFTPPTLEEVAAYCRKQGNSIDPRYFHAYYEANGWKVGKVTMKDWKCAIRLWERGDKKREAELKARRKINRDRGGWVPPPISNTATEATLAEARKAGI